MAAAAFASQAVTSAGSAYNESNAIRAQGQYQKQMADINARSLDEQVKGIEDQAIDAEKRGMTKAAMRAKEIAKSKSAQKVAIAAQGGDLGSETALNIMDETEIIGEADIAAIKTNAWREAFGFTSQANTVRGEANNTRMRGEVANISALNTARATMITGVTNAAGAGAQSYGEKEKKSAAKKKGTS